MTTADPATASPPRPDILRDGNHAANSVTASPSPASSPIHSRHHSLRFHSLRNTLVRRTLENSSIPTSATPTSAHAILNTDDDADLASNCRPMPPASVLRPLTAPSPFCALPRQTYPHRFPWQSRIQAARRLQARRAFGDGPRATIQQVHLKRPPIFTWNRFLRFSAYAVPVSFAIWYTFLRDVDWSELDAEEDEQADEEVEVDEDAWFIPLTWARKMPREFYKGSDPEWQAFKAFSADSKRHVAIQKQLITTTRTAAANHKGLQRVLGKVDHKAGRVMLSITFPDGPPQAYEMTGIYITDDAILYGPKEVSQMNYLRLKNALVPTAAFWSIYTSSKYIVMTQYHQIRQALGFDPPGPPGLAQMKERLEQARQGKGGESSPTPQIGPLPPVGADQSTRTATSSSGGEVKSKRPAPPKIPLDPSAQSSLTGEQSRQPIALSLFMHTFTKNASRGSAEVEPPRGTVVVSGLVEVKGTDATATMDVSAAYDLKQSKYVIVSMGVKKIKPRVQSPKGGP